MNSGVTVVVPLDYALNADRDNLSPASIQTLSSACAYISKTDKEKVVLVCGNTNHPQNHMRLEDSVHLRVKMTSSLTDVSCLYTEATNSIDEAENIKRRLVDLHIEVKGIHIFCDRFHARRAKLIWEYFFSETKIVVHEVDCSWGKNQAQFIQKFGIVWFFANWVAFLLMKIRGVDSIRKIKQSS